MLQCKRYNRRTKQREYEVQDVSFDNEQEHGPAAQRAAEPGDSGVEQRPILNGRTAVELPPLFHVLLIEFRALGLMTQRLYERLRNHVFRDHRLARTR